ncbi:unnamed protein product [Leptidea sinapis]|uniref:guanylate cyclase n=1 Tax=Leptidea sinapis TaxID=189913 RepID=A0A5E4QMD9_9NEOP|nr:unnamed protein product [Leptidea sinapis]
MSAKDMHNLFQNKFSKTANIQMYSLNKYMAIVYVFLGENIALVDFVNVLLRRGLLSGGEYAVVAVDDEIYDPSTAEITQAGEDHYIINVPIEAAHLYDAVLLWARAATAAIRAGVSPTDGSTIMKLLRPTVYRSLQGFDVNMDSSGDAEGNYTVIGLVEDPAAPGGWSARPVATFHYTNSSDVLPIAWINGRPPVAEPDCGFDGRKCALKHDPGVIAAIAAVTAAAVLALTLLLRHYRYEQKLASVLWRIEAKDLIFITGCHDKSGMACIVTAYCSRGSLATIISDKDLHLDESFVASLVADLLRGLTYLHDSALGSHGNLTSSNCLVDRRFVLQISDYGLHTLKSGCIETEDALRMEQRMLWRAPELLRDPNPPPQGTQKGDVYSFGIILKTNIFDNMLSMMEKYAANLESLVAVRTDELYKEKKRTDDLLNRMLPRTVADALKRGEPVQAESYESVTVYFSDIVGFTKLAATNSPIQVVEILNELYTKCDSIISYYNVYKVETIGDAYMVVGGLPERCSRHAAEMPRYCLFGDTVNIAARLESTGEPQRIHISNTTYQLLKKIGGYHFKERGNVYIKRSMLNIRDRARLSCGGSLGPGSALSSPGPPACSCFVPQRDHHSAPVVSFCE